MKIKDVYGNITIHTRRGSKTDKAVVKEIFEENVYHLRGDMFEGNTVLDCGANIGAFTIEVLRQAKHNGVPVHIIALEPERSNLRLLKKNIEANKHLIEDSTITVLPFALGDHEGLVHISDEHGDSKIVKDGQPCNMITLDALFERLKIEKVDVAKFDIEGGEIPTILSASYETIDKIKYTMIEFDEHNGLDRFADLVNVFARKCSIDTLGVPARGCYLYTERHI
jgi:FkbM family methyltransferase